MKKFFIAVAIVCSAALMTACGDKEACYDVTVSATMMGDKIEQNVKVYGTENDVKATIEEVKTRMNAAAVAVGIDLEFDITKKKLNLSQDDCK